jgi:hypothetical protein
MKMKRLSAIILLVVMVGLLFFILLRPGGNQETINLDKTKKDVLAQIKSSKEYVKNTAEWMGGDKTDEDFTVFNPPHSKNKNQNQDPKKDVVNYFLAGLLTNDVDLFLSSFYVQSISEDLFKKENPDKTEVVKEIMKSITRNGQLKDVKYEDKKGVLNTETDKLVLVFTYKDNKQAKITLQVMPVSDSHEGNKASILVISTSAWNIIEQIETQTK